jgi:hypothetical protein
MAKTRFIHFYGTFKDLYEWGRGWASMSVKAKWDEFWRCEFPKMANYQWVKYIPGNGFGECGTLCGRDINVYMHPMAIYGYMSEGGVSCGGYADGVEYNYVFFDELEKLDKICKAAAEYCGGTFILDTTKEFEVEIPEERFDFTDRPNYMKNCAREVTR